MILLSSSLSLSVLVLMFLNGGSESGFIGNNVRKVDNLGGSVWLVLFGFVLILILIVRRHPS